MADRPLYVLVDSTGLRIHGTGQCWKKSMGQSPGVGENCILAVDTDSGKVIAHSLTDQETGDPSQLGPLLDQIDDEIDQVCRWG